VALMLTGHPLAPSTALMRPGWGPSLLEDQKLSGAIMWVGGDSLMMLLMLAVIAQWSATGSRARLGDWLESARRQSLADIGSVPGSAHNTGAQDTGAHDTTAQRTLGASPDVDDDEAARQAYNRMLAALHRRSLPGRDDS
jgi:putative membrane protein